MPVLFFMLLTGGAAGIDELLSKHIAHLFIRDPIVIFSELLDQDDNKSTDHFEVCFHIHTLIAFVRPCNDNSMDRTFSLQTGKP